MSQSNRKRRSRFRFQARHQEKGAEAVDAQRAAGGDTNGNAGCSTSNPLSLDASVSLPVSIPSQNGDVGVEVGRTNDLEGSFGGELFLQDPSDGDEQIVDVTTLVPEGSMVAEILAREAASAPSDQESMGRSGLKIWNWRVLWGLLMTNGSQKLTKFQYQAMRMIADVYRRMGEVGSRAWTGEFVEKDDLFLEKANISCLPHYPTLASKFRSLLFSALTVRHSDSFENVDTSKAGARAATFSADGTPQVSVRTVLPSEYARADLATGPVLDLMKSTSLKAYSSGDVRNVAAIKAEECVDMWPIVAAREYFYGLPLSISVDTEGWTADGRGNSHAEVDDVIEICVLGVPDLCREITTAFKFGVNSDGHARLRGRITSVWTVHHACRYESGLCETKFGACAEDRDHHLAEILEYAAYKSPSDFVTLDVPDIPIEIDGEDDEDDIEETGGTRRKKKKPSPEVAEARRRRKEALRQRRLQMERAWAGWKKPVVKPGDVLCILRPLQARCDDDTEGTDGSRLVVVQRFWTENEERDRHAFWVRGSVRLDASVSEAVTGSGPTQNPRKTELRDGKQPEELCSPFEESSADFFRELASCKLWNAHSGPRGPQHFQPISCVGVLDSGEEYFIYRFLLFWDGFEVTKGKSASGDGVYMVCLNLPVEARGTSNAVRIISLCPPGVKSSSVFARIQADIVEGMTDGFVDIDACGTRRRIFLDLVGCIGDTPALNAALDTLGHTATACCHLCKFVRRSGGLCGSRYTPLQHVGLKSSSARGYYQHLAVRDCNAGAESCRLLGMKPDTESKDLPLHSLREAMWAARPRIPTTCDGLPVLSGYLDPYKSCFIAPDHLLTGHLRVCVNMAFKLLPSNQYRQACEAYMLGFLQDCHLPVQNRLFDMGKKTLYSMSMTELYALSVVAEHGFRKACDAQELRSDLRHRPSVQCKDAISIVGSAARLIASLWRLPRLNRDSSNMLESFNFDSGMRHVSELSSSTDKPLMKGFKEVQKSRQCGQSLYLLEYK